ncbi:hypothetical protein ACTNCH_10960 [Candidatus Merdisoma sp. HCP28S3_D10]
MPILPVFGRLTIEVMGLAVLPSRLQKEMDQLAGAILEGKGFLEVL